METNALTAMSFLGFLFTVGCSAIGAYVLLRWGWTGVWLIWQYREVFDEIVKRDFEQATGRKGSGV